MTFYIIFIAKKKKINAGFWFRNQDFYPAPPGAGTLLSLKLLTPWDF